MAPEGEGKARTTRRAILESLAEQGDPEAVQELAALPDIPPLGAHLWAFFLDLNSTRQSNGMGASRLSRLEIRTWEEDEGVILARWERRTIMMIDAAWVVAMSEQSQPER